jgi:membrane peptidoglycan carboxypeptidase
MVLNPKGNQDVGGQGGGMGAGIWHDAMAPILTNAPMAPFPPADPVLAGSTVPPNPPPPAATTAQNTDANTPTDVNSDTPGTDITRDNRFED